MWYVYIKGAGEGCTYTVGCNEKLMALKSLSYEGAVEEFLHWYDLLIVDRDAYDTLQSIGHYIEDWKSVKFLYVEEELTYNLRDYRDEIKSIIEAEDEAERREMELQAEDKERQEYERLKAKYG